MFHLTYKIKQIFSFTVFLICLIFLLIVINYSSISFKTQFFATSSFPAHDDYPGNFLNYEDRKLSNISYCNFNYGLPDTLLFEMSDLGYGPELQDNSPYRILYNVIEGEVKDNIPAVTYATHFSSDFLNYIAELVRYWDGYISVPAYVTESDIIFTINQINKLCFCLPEMSRVSLHLVFPSKLSNLSKYIQFQKPSTCIITDSTKRIVTRNFQKKEMYPVNVCRNAARTASLTEYVLVSDVQLMPSQNLAMNFINMVKSLHFKTRGGTYNNVYVIPVFEIERYETIPRTKDELMLLVRNERAVYFHRLVCIHCQKFPGLENWFETSPNTLKPFLTAKREIPFHRWEPIYIGTKNEPYYSEVLSWEGLQDKMTQMLEMCLIGYNFIILDGAFLVHWPGIKKTKSKDKEHWKIPYEKENSRQYNKILKQLSSKYASNSKCKVQ